MPTREERRLENLAAFRERRNTPRISKDASPEEAARKTERFNRNRRLSASRFAARQLAFFEKKFRVNAPQPQSGFIPGGSPRDPDRRADLALEATRQRVQDQFGDQFTLEDLLSTQGSQQTVARSVTPTRRDTGTSAFLSVRDPEGAASLLSPSGGAGTGNTPSPPAAQGPKPQTEGVSQPVSQSVAPSADLSNVSGARQPFQSFSRSIALDTLRVRSERDARVQQVRRARELAIINELEQLKASLGSG